MGDVRGEGEYIIQIQVVTSLPDSIHQLCEPHEAALGRQGSSTLNYVMNKDDLIIYRQPILDADPAFSLTRASGLPSCYFPLERL